MDNLDIKIDFNECSLKELKLFIDKLIAEHGENSYFYYEIDSNCDGWRSCDCTESSHYHLDTFLKKID